MIDAFFNPLSLVMESAGNDEQFFILVLAYQSVRIVDSSGPEPGQISFQGLRFAQPPEGTSDGVSDENIDLFEGSLIRRLPIQVLFPGLFGEVNHASRWSGCLATNSPL